MRKLALTPQHVDVTEPAPAPEAGLADFETIYERDFDYVWRTLCRFGVPAADVPDAGVTASRKANVVFARPKLSRSVISCAQVG